MTGRKRKYLNEDDEEPEDSVGLSHLLNGSEKIAAHPLIEPSSLAIQLAINKKITNSEQINDFCRQIDLFGSEINLQELLNNVRNPAIDPTLQKLNLDLLGMGLLMNSLIMQLNPSKPVDTATVLKKTSHLAKQVPTSTKKTNNNDQELLAKAAAAKNKDGKEKISQSKRNQFLELMATTTDVMHTTLPNEYSCQFVSVDDWLFQPDINLNIILEKYKRKKLGQMVVPLNSTIFQRIRHWKDLIYHLIFALLKDKTNMQKLTLRCKIYQDGLLNISELPVNYAILIDFLSTLASQGDVQPDIRQATESIVWSSLDEIRRRTDINRRQRAGSSHINIMEFSLEEDDSSEGSVQFISDDRSEPDEIDEGSIDVFSLINSEKINEEIDDLIEYDGKGDVISMNIF